jgi:hypothetical protein
MVAAPMVVPTHDMASATTTTVRPTPAAHLSATGLCTQRSTAHGNGCRC